MVASPVGSFAIVDDATEKVTLSYSGLPYSWLSYRQLSLRRLSWSRRVCSWLSHENLP